MTTRASLDIALPRLKALTWAVLSTLPAIAWANPLDPTVVTGNATFQQAGSTLTVTNTPGSVIHWQSFSIGQNELTRFVQQSSASQVLNRVVGADPSQILGTLQSNGQVFLINPNGIAFGPNARVDVAGLVASSLNISNADFAAGRLNFSATLEAGAIRNDGRITALSGGNIYLIAPTVENHGVIQAADGAVVLAAGKSATLVDTHRPDVQVQISAPDNEAVNVGQIVGGHIGIYAGAIRNEGTVSASTAVIGENGNVVFKAATSLRLGSASKTLASGDTGGTIRVESDGTTVVDGQVKAVGATGNGGSVTVVGDTIRLDDTASVDASGKAGGGTILIGGDLGGGNPAIRNARYTTVGAGAVLTADAIDVGTGGRIVTWSDDTTRFAGFVSARGGAAGGNGGFAEVSGKQHLGMTGHADLSAPQGHAGELLLDPGSVSLVAGNADPIGTDSFSVGWLSTQLANSGVTISTANSTNNAAQTITLSAPLSWTSSNTLTLVAGTSISLNANVTMTGGTLAFSAPQATTIGAVTISGGRLQDNGSAGLVSTNFNTILDGVTLDARLAIPADNSMRIRNGLTLDGGSILLTNNSSLRYEGTQSILAGPGGGQILLGSTAGAPNNSNSIYYWASNTGLTIGAGVTVRPDATNPGGGTITLAYGPASGSIAGHVLADHGRTITIDTVGAGTWSNTGTLEATGGTLILNNAWSSTAPGSLLLGTGGKLNLGGSFTTASFETLDRTNGVGSLELNGTLDNTGDTLTLDASTGTMTAQSSGSIVGGTIAGEAGRLRMGSNSILDGVTLTTQVDVPVDDSMRIRNGLTLDGGSILLTNNSSLRYEGTQSILAGPGGGQILLGSTAGTPNDSNHIYWWTSNMGLTIGAGVTVRPDATNPGGGTITLAYGPASGSIAGHVLADHGRTLVINTDNGGTWSNTGTLEATGGTLKLNNAWSSTAPGSLLLGTGGKLNLGGSFTTASFETLDRTNGVGSLELNGTLDNTGDTLTLDASTGTMTAQSSGSIVGGTIAGEAGRLRMGSNSILDGVTLTTQVDVPVDDSMRIRNGLTLDGGSILLANNSSLRYEGTQSILAGPGGGQILLGSTAGTPNDSNHIYWWTSNMGLTIGAGVTVRPDATNPGGGTITLAYGPASGSIAGHVLADHGRTLVINTDNGGTWSNTGTLEATGGTLKLNNAWSSTAPGSLLLGTGGKLNLGGSFTTASFETLDRTNGVGSLELNGTLDNTGDTLTLDASTGTMTAQSSGSIVGGTIAGEAGRLRMGSNSILDGVTLTTQVDVPVDDSMRIRNGLTLDGGSILLANNSSLRYEGTQSILAGPGGGQILLGSTAGTPNDSNHIYWWTSNMGLTIGAGVTVRPDATNPGGGTITLAYGPASGSIAGHVLADHGRTLVINTDNGGTWSNTGTLEATGGTLKLNNAWSSTAPGSLLLGAGGTLNLGGSFTTASFETLDRTNGVGSLELNGTLDNTGDTLTLDASTGTMTAQSSGSIVGGTIAGEAGRLRMGSNSILDGVTLTTQVDVPVDDSMRIRNGLTLDGGSILLANNSSLRYEGTQSILAGPGGGQILLGSTAGTPNDSNHIYWWTSNMGLTIGAGVTVRPDATNPGGGTITLAYGPASGSIAGHVLADHGRTLVINTDNGGTWSNTGTLEATGGTLKLNNAWSSTAPGSLLLGAGGTLNLGGSFTTASFETLDRTGGVGTLNLTGTLDNSGDVLTLDDSTGRLNMVSGGVITGGSIAFTAGNFDVASGFFQNVTLASDLIVDGNDQLRVLGTLTLGDGVTLQIGGPTVGTSYVYQGSGAAWGIAGNGTVLFGGSSGNSSSRNLGSGGAPLTIGPGVTVRAEYDSTIAMGGGAVQGSVLTTTPTSGSTVPTLTIDGNNWITASTGSITAGAGTLTVNNLLRNDGMVVVNGGTLNFNTVGNTFVWTSPGTMRLDSGILNLGGRLTTATFDTILRPNDADRGTFNVRATIDNTGSTLTFDDDTGAVNLTSGLGTILNGSVAITSGGSLRSTQGFFQDVTLLNDMVLEGNDQLRILGTLTLANGVTFQIGGDTNGTSYLYQGNSSPWAIAGSGTVLFGGNGTSVGRNLGSGSAPLTIGANVTVHAAKDATINIGTGGTNQGTILADTTGADLTINGSNWINAATGTVTASGGSLTANGMLRNDGTIVVSGGTFGLNTGDSTSVWTNPGTLRLDSGTLNLGGRITTATFDTITRPNDADRGTFNVRATIDNTGSTLTFDDDTGAVNLTSGLGTVLNGSVAITGGGSLRSTQGFFQDVTLLNDMVLEGNDQLRVLGTLTLANGVTFQIGGDTNGTSYLYQGNSSPWAIAGSGTVLFGGNGTSVGRNLGSGGAPLTIGANVTVHAAKDATINIGTGGTNQGTILADTTGADLTINGSNWINAATGTVTASGGSLTANGMLRNDGTIVVSGGTFGLNTGDNTSVWTNPGTLRLDSGTLNLGGRITTATFDTITRPNDADRGTFNVRATIDNTGSTLTFDDDTGAVNLTSGLGTILNGSVAITGSGSLRSTLGFLQDVTLLNDMVVEGSDQLRILGALTLANGVTLQIGGASNGTSYVYQGNANPWSITGNGTVLFGGNGVSVSRNLGSGSAPLTLGGGIIVRASKDASIAMGTGGVNQSTILADTAGATLSITGTNWTNPGALSATNAGTLSLSGISANSGVIGLGLGSTISTNNTNLLNTGIITGAGTITLDTGGAVETLTNRGTIRVNGDALGFLTVRGNLTLDSGSILEIDIRDHLGRGSGYDSLTVRNALSLVAGSQIRVTHRDGFTPSAAELFALISAGSISGSTAVVGLSGDSTGYALNTQGNLLFLTRGTPGTVNVWNIDTDGDWGTAANWSLGRTPQSTDIVLIDRGPVNPTVTVSTGSQNAGTIISPEAVTLSGGTLTVASASSIAGNFLWNGGTLAGAGQLSLLGTGTWSRGTLNGNLRVASGATLTGNGNGDGNSGTARALGSGTLTNDGTVVLVSGQTDIVGSGLIVNNGLFDIQNGMNIGDRWTGTGTFSFANNSGATLLKSAGTSEAAIGSLGVVGGTANYVNFTNAGLIEARSGALRFNIGYSGAAGGGTFTSTGTIRVSQGASVDFGGTANLLAGSVLEGAGTISTSLGAVLNVAGAFNLTGGISSTAGTAVYAPTTSIAVDGLTLTGGTVRIDAPLSSNAVSVNSSTLTLNGGSSVASLNLASGTLDGTGVVTMAGNGTWGGGLFGGHLVVPAGRTFTVSAGTKTLGAATITNDGTLVLLGATVDVSGNGSLVNNGLIDIQGNFALGDFGEGTGTVTIVNSATGTLLTQPGTTATLGSMVGTRVNPNYVSFTNSGLIDVRSNIIQFNVGQSGGSEGGQFTNTGTMTVAAGSTLRIAGTFDPNAGTIEIADTGFFRKIGGFTNAQAGVVRGSGTLELGTGNALINDGQLLESGVVEHLRISGNLVLGSAGTLNVDVGGTAAGTTFDRIDVTGSIALGGNLDAGLIGGFVPTDGNTFPFLSAASFSGDFAANGVQVPANFSVIFPGPTVGLEFRAFQCAGSICWDGGASTSSWTDADNWTGDRLPGPGDIVIVNAGGSSPITLDSGNHQIGAITLNESLTMAGGSLLVSGPAISTLAAPITITSGTLTLAGPTDAQSTIAVNGGTLATSGNVFGTASVSLTAGSATFGGITSLAAFTQSGGSSAFNGNTTIAALTHGGGEGVTLAGTGDVLVTDSFDWRNEADLRGTGRLITEGATTITGSGGLGFGLVKPWENRGTVTMLNGAHIHFATETASGAIINTATGVFNLGDAATPLDIFNGSGYVIANGGTFVKTSPGTQTIGSGVQFVNSGTIDVQAGTLAFGNGFPANGGTIRIANGAEMRTIAGFANVGLIEGQGTLNLNGGTLVNGGTIAPAGTNAIGTLTLSGNLQQDSSGRVEIEVAGTGAGERDVLAVSGSANLAGTLAMSAIGSYVPTAGDSLGAILIYNTRTGSFSTVELPNGVTLTGNQNFGTSALTLALIDAGCVADVCWVGTSGDWNDPQNWSTGVVPTAAQSVRISVAGDQTISVTSGVQAAGSITTDEVFNVSAGSITIGGPATFSSAVNLSGGTFTTNGNTSLTEVNLTGGAWNIGSGATATIANSLAWTRGATISGPGTLALTAGSASSIDSGAGGGFHVLSNVTLNNAGSVSYNVLSGNSQDLLLNNGAQFNNLSGGTFEFRSDVNVGATSAAGAFNNAGTVRKEAGTGTSGFDVAFNNTDGTLDSGTGTLGAGPGGTHTGSLTIVGNNVRFDHGTHTFGDAIAVEGTLNLAGATANFSDASLADTVNLTAGTINIAAQQEVVASGTFNWTAGATVNGPGTLTLAQGSTANITSGSGGGFHVLSNVTLNNAGTATYNVLSGNSQELLLNNGAQFNNLSGGTFEFRSDANVDATSAAGAFNNAGTVRKAAGSGTSGFDVAFNNTDGTVDSGTGTLSMGPGGTHGGALTLVGDRVLFDRGSHVVNGHVFGTLNLTGATVEFGDSLVDGRLNLSGGNLNVRDNGTVDVLGGLHWTSGASINDLGSTGKVVLSSGSSNTITGSGFKVLNGSTLVNAGTLDYDVLAGNGQELLLNNGAEFINLTGGTFRFAKDSSVGATSAAGRFTNQGTVQKTGGTGTSGFDVGFDNAGGTLDSGTGALNTGTGGTHTGTTTILGNNVVFNRGTHAFADGSTVDGRVVVSGATVNFGDVRMLGALDFQSGAVNVLSGKTLATGSSSVAVLDSKTIGGGGTISNEGSLTLNGVTIVGNLINRGAITVQGSTSTVTGSNTRIDLLDGSRLTLAPGASLAKDGGTVNWIGGALGGTGTLDLRLLNGATIALGSGSKFLDGPTLSLSDLDLDGTLTLSNGTLNIDGTTRINPGAFLNLSGGTLNAGTVNNDGVMTVSAGSVSLDGGGTHSGTFMVSDGAAIRFDGGTHTFAGGSSVVASLTTGKAVVDGSTVNIAGPVQMANLDLVSGEITGAGSLTIGNQFNWTGGRQSGTGQTVVAETASMAISGANDKSLETRTLVNDSVAGSTWTGTGAIDAQIPSNALSTFVNNGRFTIDTDAPWLDGFLVNNGTIVKTGGAGIQVFNDESGGLSNAGMIDVQAGTLLLRGTGTHTGAFQIADEAGVTFEPGTNFVRGTHTLADGTTFGGQGTATIAGPGVVLGGTGTGALIGSGVTLDLKGQTVTGAGQLTNEGTLVLGNSVLGGNLVNTGIVRVDANSQHDGARVDMNGGRIEVAAGSTVTKSGGTFEWNDGTLAGPGAYDLINGATFAMGGSGQRVIDGAPILLPSLAVDAGSLELRSGSLTVGGGTRFAPGTQFVVNDGTATLFGAADIASLAVNGGTLDARSGLSVDTLAQSGGQILGSGALNVASAFQRTGGMFDPTWQSIAITQASGDLLIDQALTATGALTLDATSGALRVLAPLTAGGPLSLHGGSGMALLSDIGSASSGSLSTAGGLTVTDANVTAANMAVSAGSLQILAETRAASLAATSGGGLDAQIGGDVNVQGGSAAGASATLGSATSPCSIDVGGALTLTGGSAAGSSAEVLGAQSIGTTDAPISVTGPIRMFTGSAPAPARIAVASTGSIFVELPQFSQDGAGITVDGQPVTAAGVSGFFVNGAQAVVGENLFLRFGLASQPAVVAEPLHRSVPAAEAQVAQAVFERNVATLLEKSLQLEEDPVNSFTQRRVPECR